MSEFNLFVYGTLRGGGPSSVHGVASSDHGAASEHGTASDHGAATGDGAGSDRGASAPRGSGSDPATAQLMTGCVRVAEGTIGGTLYDIDGRFPALVYYGNVPVRGEIWRCPADLLLALDSYEGTATGLFRRMAVEVETDTGDMLPCWVYTAGPALSRQLTPSNRVATGVWQARTA